MNEKEIVNDAETGLQQLQKCEADIEAHERTRYPARYAWFRIETEELWHYSPDQCSSFEEYVQKKGYDKSYISRLTRAVRFCDEMQIPPGLMPCEGSLRPLMKKCFTKEDREAIYRDACCNARNRMGIYPFVKVETGNSGSDRVGSAQDREVASGNDKDCVEKESENEGTRSVTLPIDVKPNAQDIRDAIDSYHVEDQIILTSIEERVDRETTLGEILQRFSDKIVSETILLSILQDYVSTVENNIEPEDVQAAKKMAEKLVNKFYERIDNILNGEIENISESKENE